MYCKEHKQEYVIICVYCHAIRLERKIGKLHAWGIKDMPWQDEIMPQSAIDKFWEIIDGKD